MGGYLCVGAADRFLGMLAHTLGRLDDAAAHYTTALELEQRLKAAPLTARTRYWCAHTLHTRRAPTDEEIEMVNSLHGAIFHLSVRRWINKTITGDLTRYIALKVDLFLHGFIAEKLVS